ncbi:MAG: Nif11-like leader peptide family natural product precursor [Ruminiclostridium sp.]|nr:Nif11-like leader peptide family natural product precursor [Ruminiclostridium sp.]
MSKETAKKLIAELQTNEELKAKVSDVTNPVELTKIAVDAGYDVTLDELIEADKEYRKELAENTGKKLSINELESAAGGSQWNGEDNPEGHKVGCESNWRIWGKWNGEDDPEGHKVGCESNWRIWGKG